VYIRILGIESTCDETGAAVVAGGQVVLSNVLASSSHLQAPYGGVFPEIASRFHLEVIQATVEQACVDANLTLNQVDAIAFAKGPGLLGALLIGSQFAKGLSLSLKKPLLAINHVEAHLYAAVMGAGHIPPLPALGLVISGGHTLLLEIQTVGRYRLLGTTVDDALGEAFDKVATLLGLSYPGGAALETMAQQGDPNRFPFKAGKVKQNPLDFSYSGLKTALLYATRGSLSQADLADLAASFQNAVASDLIEKINKALKMKPQFYQSLWIGGGVSQNQYLQTKIQQSFSNLPIFPSPPSLTQDNGAMIAGLAYHHWLQHQEGVSLSTEVHPRTVYPKNFDQRLCL
jgi:N6-L-threonylcarbamoyladenine synthase